MGRVLVGVGYAYGNSADEEKFSEKFCRKQVFRAGNLQ